VSLELLMVEIRQHIPDATAYSIWYDTACTELIVVVPTDEQKSVAQEIYYNFETHTPIDGAVFVETDASFAKNCRGFYQDGFRIIQEAQVHEVTDN